MTMALCMTCGNVKFGAICPCPECGVASTGDMGLDIAFSDHRLDVTTLKELGGVVRAIRGTCRSTGAGDDVQFWSFITYVSTHHPSILTATPPPELAPRANDVLGRTRVPNVTLRPCRTRGTAAPAVDGGAESGRKWWQFWKRGDG